MNLSASGRPVFDDNMTDAQRAEYIQRYGNDEKIVDHFQSANTDKEKAGLAWYDQCGNSDGTPALDKLNKKVKSPPHHIRAHLYTYA